VRTALGRRLNLPGGLRSLARDDVSSELWPLRFPTLTVPRAAMSMTALALMYGEVVLAPIHAVVKHPKGLSPVEAASIWMMFVAAYGAVIEDAKITSEDAVVIPGGLE